jgi:hypothetical protein
MRSCSRILFLLPILLVASHSTAQEARFISDLAGADLTPAQSKALSDITSLPTTGESRIVRADTTMLRVNDEVQIPLPGRGSVSVATADKSFTGDSAFAVVGRTASLDSGPPKGDASDLSTFSVNGDSITGSIQTDSGLFRIRPLGGGVHVLFKVGKFPEEHPIMPPSEGGNRQDLPPLKLKDLEDHTMSDLKILVAYTPTVASRAGDVSALTDLAFIETNASYANSDVFIRAIPATPKPVATSYAESGTFEGDLAALKTPGDGKMDELLAMRDEMHADIVVLLTNTSSFCGLASDILGSKESAFAIVYHDCATGYYSFGHEIGHIQGARHNPEADPISSPFSYGHGFMDPVRNRRSVMSYDCPNGCARLPQWARPEDWGNQAVSNDARVLNETRELIASFR